MVEYGETQAEKSAALPATGDSGEKIQPAAL